MTAADVFYGGMENADVAGDYSLSITTRLYILNPTAGTENVELPDARNLQAGGPQFWIVNDGGGNDFEVWANGDIGGTLLFTVSMGEVVELLLYDTSSQAGQWLGEIYTWSRQ